MKKKQVRDYDYPARHISFLEVLEGRGDRGENETRGSIMNQIQDVFEACYFLGMNPLSELRRILPFYRWTFHCIDYESDGKIRRVITTSDFIWRTNWANDDGDIQLVTATRNNRTEPLKFFWAGGESESRPDREMTDFVKEFGGEPVYLENE